MEIFTTCTVRRFWNRWCAIKLSWGWSVGVTWYSPNKAYMSRRWQGGALWGWLRIAWWGWASSILSTGGQHQSSFSPDKNCKLYLIRQFIWREIAKLRLRSSILYLRDQVLVVTFSNKILSPTSATNSYPGTKTGQQCSSWSTHRGVLDDHSL